MKCEKCGASLPASGFVCKNCGAPIKSVRGMQEMNGHTIVKRSNKAMDNFVPILLITAFIICLITFAILFFK